MATAGVVNPPTNRAKSDPHPHPFPLLSASVYVCSLQVMSGISARTIALPARLWLPLVWLSGTKKTTRAAASGHGRSGWDGSKTRRFSRFASLWVVDRYHRLAGWLGVYVVGGSGSDAAGRTRPGLRCQSMPSLTAHQGGLAARAVIWPSDATRTCSPILLFHEF
jgi:hypothetical protein